jgi:hypothetical protein
VWRMVTAWSLVTMVRTVRTIRHRPPPGTESPVRVIHDKWITSVPVGPAALHCTALHLSWEAFYTITYFSPLFLNCGLPSPADRPPLPGLPCPADRPPLLPACPCPAGVDLASLSRPAGPLTLNHKHRHYH